MRIGRWTNTWTNLVSGALTIAIGILIIRTDGTTSLGGVLDTEQQFHVENWALRSTRDIPDVAVVAAAVAVLLVAWRVRRRHTESTRAARRSNSERPPADGLEHPRRRIVARDNDGSVRSQA